jgi:Ribosomal protein S1
MPRKKAAPAEAEPNTQEERAPNVLELGEGGARSELQQFFALDFNELDRDLKEDERSEWNAIYASYRGRSALSGKIIGVDRFINNLGGGNTQEMYCAIVILHRVRIIIPSAEMWMDDYIPPDYVLRGTVGASIDFVITRVEREAGFAMASRREAMRNQRYYFSRRRELSAVGAETKCQVLSVGPRRCTVECYGHDMNLTQRDLSYTAISDLRAVYHPGDELSCVVKSYDAEKGKLVISVKEAQSNPYDGASIRHPVGSRRQAVISGKYGGGVFCNLPDGTVCMCNYSYQYTDADFKTGDIVILLIHRFDDEKKQMYGKILSKW